MREVKRQKLAAALWVGWALTLPVVGQIAREANSQYQTHEGRQQVAANLDAPDREQRQRPHELVEAMGVGRGMTVVDVGTGIGYMLPFLSRAVGPTGKVVAEDIFEDYLASARQRAVDQKLINVAFIHGTDKDPKLPARSADRVLVLDVYHHFDYPEAMLAGISKSLKSDGRLVIVEYYKSDKAMPNGRALTHIRLDKRDVIKEIEANHFRLLSEREQIADVQYMLVFDKAVGP